jgi:arylsulfatase A-like enzyme
VPTTRRELLVAGAAVALAAPFVPLGGGAGARGSPNVLVLVVDTLRADHVYGDRARTPSMDSLIDVGLSFTRAVPEAMPTVPARNSILSGRRSFPFRGWHDYRGLMNSPGWFPLHEPERAWTSVLRRAGYWTGYVTDNPFLGFSYPYEPLRRSFDLFVRRGGQLGGTSNGVPNELLEHWMYPALRDPKEAERMRRYLANGGYARDEADTFVGRVFRSGVDALEQAARRRPFALVVDTFAPHEPWTPPKRYLDLYGDPDWRGPEPGTLRYSRVENWLGEEEAPRVLKRLRALYAAELTMTDRWIGVLLERLHELGLERDTVIVLVGDHGIFIGERGWTGKISVALHPELVRVPLVIVDPARRRAGTTSAYRASTHDIGPTLLSMTGVDPPREMEGVDLSQLFHGRELPKRPFSHGGYANSHYLRSDRWTFFADNRMQRPQLYDRRKDHAELHNVAERHPDVVRELHARVVEEAGGPLPYYPG